MGDPLRLYGPHGWWALREQAPERGPVCVNASGGTLARGTLVKITTAEPALFADALPGGRLAVDAATAPTDLVLGVLDEDVEAGEMCAPLVGGVVRVQVSETVVAGDPLTPTTGGQAAVAASTEVFFGVAASSCEYSAPTDPLNMCVEVLLQLPGRAAP